MNSDDFITHSSPFLLAASGIETLISDDSVFVSGFAGKNHS